MAVVNFRHFFFTNMYQLFYSFFRCIFLPCFITADNSPLESHPGLRSSQTSLYQRSWLGKMKYANGFSTDLLLVINISYLSHCLKFASSYIWQSSCYNAIYKHRRTYTKTLYFFCFEHNDRAQFELVSYANWSVWEMEVFSFRKYSSVEKRLS